MAKLGWGEGRVRFFTLKAEIETALRAGQPKRAVWAQLQDQLGIGYAGFVRLTVRYIGAVLPTVPLPSKTASRTRAVTVDRRDENNGQPVEASQSAAVHSSTAQPVRLQPGKLKFNNQPSREWLKEQLSRPKPKEG